MTHVSVSDRARAIAELELERHALYAQSAGLTLKQQAVWEEASKTVRRLGHEQISIMVKLIALEETAEKLMGEMK